MGAKPHDLEHRKRRHVKMDFPDQKTRSIFCVLFFLEPGKARRTCAGSFVKEAREHMFTVRLLDREG